METEAIGSVNPLKVSGYVSATLKMWRFKRQYEQYLEEVRRRRLEMNGGELALANRLLSSASRSTRLPTCRRSRIAQDRGTLLGTRPRHHNR